MHGLGKEELLVEVARAFQSQVYVDQERMDQIQVFEEDGWDGIFTTKYNPESCRIVCIRRGKGGRVVVVDDDDANNVMMDSIDELQLALNIGSENDVFITPSGWCGMEAFDNLKRIVALPQQQQQQHVAGLPKSLRVPYSLHATHAELVRFVRECDFQYVIPIVNISASDRDELEIDSIKRWEKSTIDIWDRERTSSSPHHKKPKLVDENDDLRLSKVLKPSNGLLLLASPVSHKRRLEAKKTRFQRPHTENEFADFEIVFRREGNVLDEWTKNEDEVLRLMHHKRLIWDCVGHEQERRKLKRSDNEIFLRLSYLREETKLMM